MGRITSTIHRIIGIGTGISSVFLAMLMLLIVTVVVLRPFDKVVTGSYELIQLLAVVVIAFALSFTALKQSHISVSILVSRFTPRTQAIVDSVTLFLGLIIWGWVFWAGVDIMLQKWLLEVSDMLKVPFLPFRIVWVLGLLIFTLVYLIDMVSALKKAVRL